MATNTLVSPGVLALENDQSFITQNPVNVGAAIIGPTVKGPAEVPTIVTSYSDYQNKFGTTFLSGSNIYTYFTSIAAFNYFNNGGNTMLVSRVVSGTFTSATTSGSQGTPILNSNTSESLRLKTISQGTNQNSTSSIDISGSLLSGSVNNIRYQIANNDTGSGTFSIVVRQGDDNTNNQIVLETWTNLSMDTTAPNYVARVIGDQFKTYNSTDNQIVVSGTYPNASRYIYVDSVLTPTPLYFDNTGNAKAQFTGSIPVNASGSFGGATGNLAAAAGAKYYDAITSAANNIQGLFSQSYDNMIF